MIHISGFDPACFSRNIPKAGDAKMCELCNILLKLCNSCAQNRNYFYGKLINSWADLPHMFLLPW